MKKIILKGILLLILLFTITILVLSIVVITKWLSVNKRYEGKVIEKTYLEARVETVPVIITVFNGTTVVPMTVLETRSYPDRWYITIQWQKDENYEDKKIYVTKECYESVNIGEWFIYDEEYCTEIEPCDIEHETLPNDFKEIIDKRI